MKASVLSTTIENAIHRISRWIRFASQGALFIMIFIVTAGVIARYIFNSPFKGDMEIQELMMVLIVFLAFPFCQLEKGNVYVEIVANRFKGWTREFFHSLVYLLGFIIIALIVWQMSERAISGFAEFHRHVTLTLWIPITPFVLIATIGFALMGLEWLIELVHSVRKLLDKGQANSMSLPEQELQGNSSK